MNISATSQQDRFLKFYSITLFLYLLHSMHPWFLLWLPTIWGSIIFFFVSILAAQRNYFNFSSKYTSIILFFLMFLWIKRDANINGIIEAFINGLIFSTVISLRKDLMLYIFVNITKWMGILVGVSAVAFLLHILGMPLPHRPLSADGAFESLQTDNYFLFINAESFTDLGRFRAVFYEPGYLTLGVASLLYLNKYNVRNKYVLALLFAQMLSFSLAGFVLLAFGYLFCSLCQVTSRNKKSMIIGGLAIIISFYMLSIFLGDSYLQDTLFSRLEWVDGTISGNNRSSSYLDSVYDAMMKSSDKWTGTDFDIEMSEHGVSGYRLFAVQNGLIGVILTIIAFFSLIPRYNRYRINLMLGAVLVLLLILYQNAYPSAFCILFPAACIRYVFEEDSKLV